MNIPVRGLSVIATMLLALLTAALLVACSASTSTSGARQSTHSMRGGNQLLTEVRAAGELGNELDVQPLRDPQVEDLRALATSAEARGDYAGAERALTQALALVPNDPDLLQWQAEMALVRHDWARAQSFAMQSWERGPKLGGLCRRNWTTLRLAAEARSDAAAVAMAQQRSGACAVAPPTRY